MSQRSLDLGLDEVKQSIAAMAGLVETAIEAAIQGFRARSVDKLQDVHAIEIKVNQSHVAIDASCLKLLATQQPMASDLRLILGIIKINNDLERMVDQAVNISHNAEHYIQYPPVEDVSDLSEMSDEVKWMVRNTIDAFVKSDVGLANEVCRRDDRVDAYKNSIFKKMVEKIRQDSEMVEQGLNLILIARNLERIGDHATNIAEDVIFTVSGEDIRHRKKEQDGKKENSGG